uniref:C-type lectin domain-containing protein n=1 Tax=Anser brachyrhynchus TaxID=132585 RepID=A0A8B9BEM3_9AVES
KAGVWNRSRGCVGAEGSEGHGPQNEKNSAQRGPELRVIDEFREQHFIRRLTFPSSAFPNRSLFSRPALESAPREWEYFDGKCYYFSIDRMSWYKAKTQCEEMHSRLAIINSFAKQNFVMFRTRNERFWIGLTDGNSEGEWEWIDGTDYKSTFTFWKEGEPNNSGNNEDCAHVWTSGQWNDVYCTFECYYLCEKPVPH